MIDTSQEVEATLFYMENKGTTLALQKQVIRAFICSDLVMSSSLERAVRIPFSRAAHPFNTGTFLILVSQQ